MFQNEFKNLYTKFKLHFYQKIFEGIETDEAPLTTVEIFCMEIIYAMDRPTVAEFSRLANLSSPNAAYKVNSLVTKGYLRKVQSESDKREYHLEVTEKYLEYYNISYQYMDTVMRRVEERFSPEEIATLEKILAVTTEELMPEVKG